MPALNHPLSISYAGLKDGEEPGKVRVIGCQYQEKGINYTKRVDTIITIG